jgi:predicted PurR-regulated permease PerM
MELFATGEQKSALHHSDRRGQLKMAFPERRTADVLLTILLFLIVCGVIYSARRILLIFVFAILFAYLSNPVVKLLQRYSLLFRNLKGPAVVEVYVLFMILIALLLHGFAPSVARNSVKMIDEIPALLDGLSTGSIATEVGEKYGWSDQQEFRFRAYLARHTDDIQAMVRGVDRYLSNAAQLIGSLLLIPVLAIFFLRDGDHIADMLIQVLFSESRRPWVRAVVAELDVILTKYIRAQVLLCGLSFVFYSIALVVLRFPHAIALATLGGLLEFIPVAGWISTAAAIVGVGVVNHSHWIWMAAALTVWRLFQDYFATPRIMGRHLEIHPLAAISAVLVGAEIGGIVGIFLAVPVMASVRVIWNACADPASLDREYRSLVTPESACKLVQTPSS